MQTVFDSKTLKANYKLQNIVEGPIQILQFMWHCIDVVEKSVTSLTHQVIFTDVVGLIVLHTLNAITVVILSARCVWFYVF